ncbi:MAG: thioesterase family protein [Vicinamibacteria bacterium]
MSSAFYVSDGGDFVSTELTRGPWDPGAQHAGPPAALIGRELERTSPEGWAIGRITYEILRPVPIAPLRVEVEVVRPGRSVELLSATLRDRSGEPLIRAAAWRLGERELEIPSGLAQGPAPVPGPEQGTEKPFFDTGQEVGYHTAMEYRFVSGGFRELGPATVWMRMRQPLIEGEQPSPLQRLLAAADTGNGVSATLDLSRYVFINVDLSVHLHRLPVSEWICLDAITVPEPNGVGLADTALHDERGPIGRALQTLLVRER